MTHPYMTTATAASVRSRRAKVAVLPVGSFEQHGDFLPLATNTIVAALIAQRIADDFNLFVLPPFTVRCSHEHAGFADTVSISPSTLTAIITDVRESLLAQGIPVLVLVNGHGGNYVLPHVVLQANITPRRMTLFPTREDWDRAATTPDARRPPGRRGSRNGTCRYLAGRLSGQPSVPGRAAPGGGRVRVDQRLLTAGSTWSASRRNRQP